MKHSWLNKPHFEKMTWSHFWEYYKFHTIFGIFALVLIITLIYSMLSNKEPDITVQIVGSSVISQEKVEPKFEEALKSVVTDANGDGAIVTDVIVKNISSYHPAEDKAAEGVKIIEWDNEPTNADRMMIEKITLDLTTGEPALYIIDGSIMEVYMGQGVFAELESLDLPKDAAVIEGESELAPGKTHIYGVSLKDNAFLKAVGIDSTDKYIGVRVVNAGQEKDEALKNNYKNAMAALKYILNYK